MGQDYKIEFTAASCVITQAAGPTLVIPRDELSDAEWDYDRSQSSIPVDFRTEVPGQ